MKKIILAFAAAMLASLMISAPAVLRADDPKPKQPKITDTSMEVYYPAGPVMARGEIKKVDGKAVKHGAWTGFYDTGEKQKEGSYKEDKMDGPWTMYHKNGNISTKMVYQEGKLNGLMESFYESGAKKAEETYALDKRDGKKTTFYEDGKVQSECTYAGGKKLGLEKTYYPDSALKSDTTYTYDKKQGVAKTFHKDGTTINVFATYDNGSLKGPWFTNYPNGTRKMQGQYIPAPKVEETEKKLGDDKVLEGHRTGKWTFFHDNGNKAQEGMYANNNREGKWKMYAKEGHLSSEGSFAKDSQTGIWNYYTDKGGLEKKLTLSGEFPSGKGWIYEEGKLVFEGDLTGQPTNLMKNGPGKEYHPTGKVKSEGEFMMNRKNGPFREYHPNGKLMAEGKYINDKRNDLWNFYKEDGVTKDEEKSGYYMMGNINKSFTPGKFEFKPSFK